MASLDPEVAAWLQSLELSIDIKNPKRDLANGCVVAEILARYYPQDVSLHSFENVSSLPLKDANWHLLLKLFRRMGLAITEQLTNRVMLYEEGAAADLMQQIWRHLAADGNPAAAAATAQQAQNVAAAPDQKAYDQAQAWQNGALYPTADARQWLASATQPPTQATAQPELGYGGAAAAPDWQHGTAQAAEGADAFWPQQQQPQQGAPQEPSSQQWQQAPDSMDAAVQQQYGTGASSLSPQRCHTLAQPWQQSAQLAYEMQQWQQHGQPPAAESMQPDLGWQRLQPQYQHQPQPQYQHQPQPQYQARQQRQPLQERQRRSDACRKASASSQPAGRCRTAAKRETQPAVQAAAQPFMPQQAVPQLANSQQATQQYWLQQQQLLQQQQMLQQQQRQEQQEQQQQQQLLFQQQLEAQQPGVGQNDRMGKRQPDPYVQHRNGMPDSKAGELQQQQQQQRMQSAAQQPAAPVIPAFYGQMPYGQMAEQYFQQAQMSANGAGNWGGAVADMPATADAANGGSTAGSERRQRSDQQVESEAKGPDDENSNSRMPTLAFDRKPRPVNFRPFTQEEFRQKNFDAKHTQKYWELGLLGPVPDEQLETKLQNRDRMREFGRRTAKQNQERLAAIAAAQAGKKPAERPLTARERAMSFAKCIQQPASAARLTQSAAGRLNGGAQTLNPNGSRLGTAQQRREDELARLQRQHEADQRDVAGFAHDLRMQSGGQAVAH